MKQSSKNFIRRFYPNARCTKYKSPYFGYTAWSIEVAEGVYIGHSDNGAYEAWNDAAYILKGLLNNISIK